MVLIGACVWGTVWGSNAGYDRLRHSGYAGGYVGPKPSPLVRPSWHSTDKSPRGLIAALRRLSNGGVIDCTHYHWTVAQHGMVLVTGARI